jgi:hypothetical protein
MLQQEKTKLRLTPKKAHHEKDSMKTPPTMGRGVSPAVSGSSSAPAIRKLCFGLVGEATITLANAKTSKLTLAKVRQFTQFKLGLWYEGGLSSLSAHFVSILNPTYLPSCTVNLCVDSKVSKWFCCSHYTFKKRLECLLLKLLNGKIL